MKRVVRSNGDTRALGRSTHAPYEGGNMNLTNLQSNEKERYGERKQNLVRQITVRTRYTGSTMLLTNEPSGTPILRASAVAVVI